MGKRGFFLVAAITLLGVLHQIPSCASLAVMSVDLGSEWIKVALVKPGVPMEIVLNKESRRKTPVVIALKDDDLQIGDPALSTATRYPKSAYFYLQDLLAKPLDAPLVQTFQKRFPYYELLQDEERGTAVFKHSEDVNYSPEELLAIILNKSREIAQDFAEQPIKDIVITVPVYFNQAERKAIMLAAELAGLKVLQLMNSNTAVALNYGVFRRNDFNATPTNIMFYDLGAGSAIATIVSYQVAKIKEKGVSETNPQLSIKGVGFDRTLGGLEMEFRLRDHLAKLFTKQKKTPNSVYDSPRSMAKLFKEAKRVKKVLSANADHFSQIEGLLDDKDFSPSKITRAELEEMNADLFERLEQPIKDALKMSEMSMSEIDQVILMGGSSRIPKVQEVLMKATGKKELGKNINADEAAAMGAVYQAAHLGKGFKVKKFVIKETNLFPIQVSFQRKVFGEDGEEDTVKTVKRTLFGRGNPYPQKKVMTFNRHTDDFTFNVGYSDLETLLSEENLKNFGSSNLTAYKLKGVGDALEKNSAAESKGIKAHFRMDESGLLYLDSVESVFEKTEQVMVEVNDSDGQSTFAKLSSTISNFFGGGGEEEENEGQPKTDEGAAETKGEESSDGDATATEDKDQEEPPKTDEDAPASEESEEEEKKEEEKKEEEKEEEEDAKEEETETEDEAKEEETAEDEQAQEAEEEAEDKESSEEEKDTTEDKTSDEDKEDKEDKADEGSEKTEEQEKETEKEDTDSEKTGKEGEKDEEDESKKKKKEKKKVSKPKVVTIKENITVSAETKDIPDATKESKKSSRDKLKELKRKEEAKQEKEIALNSLESFIYGTQDKLYSEAWEECSVDEERDLIRTSLSEASDWLYEQADDAEAAIYKDKLKEMKALVKDLRFRVKEKKERPEVEKALKDAFNYSVLFLKAAKNFSEEDQIFSDTEIKMLSDVYNDTLAWYRTKSVEQEKTPCTHPPVMLTSDMKDKYMKLDRELQYLYNKAKSQPKKKKPKKTKGKKKTSNDTETEEGNGKNGEGEEEEEKVDEGTNGDEEPQETVETEDAASKDEEKATDGDAPTEEAPTETQEEAPSENTEEEEEEEVVLQLGADDLEIPTNEEEETVEDKTSETAEQGAESKEDSNSQSENSETKTDQSDKKSDHNDEPNAHNTGEL